MIYQFRQVLRFGVLGLLMLGLANAAFIEDFDLNPNAGDVLSLNNTNTTWTIVRSVDVGGPAYGSLSCHSGNSCIDMDGSGSNPAGSISTTFATVSGVVYTVNFWVSGSQRPFLGPDRMDVTFGEAAPVIITKPQNDAIWTLHTIAFTATTTGTQTLLFDGIGGDNVGVLLDDVSLTDSSIPEPATLALIGGGLALIGLKRRK